MIDLLYKDITYDIRGACFWVYKEFGGAFKEKIIERALAEELKKRKRDVETQKKIDIYYLSKKVGCYVPDMIVDSKVLTEIKCKEFLTKQDIDQFWKYLKGSQYKVGLLINFGPKGLEIKRVVYDTARNKTSNKARSAAGLRRRSAHRSESKGFTLLELLLYIGMVAFIVLAIISFVFMLLQSRTKNQTVAEVEQQGMQVVQLITQTIRNAESINSPAQSSSDTSLSLDVVNAGDDPTIFDFSEGTIKITEGAGSAVSLINSRVVASDLTFENLSRSNTPGTIRLQFTLTHINPENKNEYDYTKTFYSNASLR